MYESLIMATKFIGYIMIATTIWGTGAALWQVAVNEIWRKYQGDKYSMAPCLIAIFSYFFLTGIILVHVGAGK